MRIRMFQKGGNAGSVAKPNWVPSRSWSWRDSHRTGVPLLLRLNAWMFAPFPIYFAHRAKIFASHANIFVLCPKKIAPWTKKKEEKLPKLSTIWPLSLQNLPRSVIFFSLSNFISLWAFLHQKLGLIPRLGREARALIARFWWEVGLTPTCCSFHRSKKSLCGNSSGNSLGRGQISRCGKPSYNHIIIILERARKCFLWAISTRACMFLFANPSGWIFSDKKKMAQRWVAVKNVCSLILGFEAIWMVLGHFGGDLK